MTFTTRLLLLYRYRPLVAGAATVLIAVTVQIASWIDRNGLSFFGRCSGEGGYSCNALEWTLRTFGPFAWPGLFVTFLVSDLTIRMALRVTFRCLGVVVPREVLQQRVRLLPIIGWAIVVLVFLSIFLGRM